MAAHENPTLFQLETRNAIRDIRESLATLADNVNTLAACVGRAIAIGALPPNPDPNQPDLPGVRTQDVAGTFEGMGDPPAAPDAPVGGYLDDRVDPSLKDA